VGWGTQIRVIDGSRINMVIGMGVGPGGRGLIPDSLAAVSEEAEHLSDSDSQHAQER